MLSLLVSRDAIVKAQAALEDIMRQEFPRTEYRDFTYRGGSASNAETWTNGGCWYRHAFLDTPKTHTPRTLNWFGIMKPGNLRIAVEVNVVPEGTNGRVKGFFARDNNTGVIYLMHTGDVGGGAPGIGGRAFRAWLGEPRIEVQDEAGNVRFGFIVVTVHASSPTRPLIRYIGRIAAFRQAVANEHFQVEDPEFQRDLQELDEYYSEPRGRRTGFHPGGIDYLSRHGEIVDALHAWRKEQGLRYRRQIVKNVFIDMGVTNARGHLVELYEVKTSSDRPDVYSAIGQLMVHSRRDCEKIIVLPKDEDLADDLMAALTRLEIQLLYFILDDEEATILEDVAD